MNKNTFVHGERELTNRERSILQAIVHNFILNASPVGSRHLSKYLQEELHLSPATLRNAMADLEEMGFIAQPHTSAGRVPTDKGYRYYVDSLMNTEQLSVQEIDTIHDNIAAVKNETTLRDVSKVLGSLSRYLSIVHMPHISTAAVQKIELFALHTRRLLVVLTLESDIVRTLSLELHFEIDPAQIELLTRQLNERISGKTLAFIRENLRNMIREAELDKHALMRLFVDSAEKLFSDHAADKADTLHIAGAHNLFDYPEFGSTSRVRGIIELIESEEIIVHLLESAAPQEGSVRVVIGSEMESSQMEEYSLLTTQYRHASAPGVGTIGLIGPKRMNYSRMISIVQYVATALSHE